MGSGEVAIVALSTMISLKVTFSDGLGGGRDFDCFCNSNVDFYSNYKISRKILPIFDGKI